MQDAQKALEEAMAASLRLDTRRMKWGTKAGAWITWWAYMVNGIERGYHKWHDALFLRNSKDPLDLPTYCAG